MKLITLWLALTITRVCQPNLPGKPTLSQQRETSPKITLIIFYDARIGKQQLLEAVRHYKATVLYEYHTMNGISIAVPARKSSKEAIRYFEKIPGVTQINQSQSDSLD